MGFLRGWVNLFFKNVKISIFIFNINICRFYVNFCFGSLLFCRFVIFSLLGVLILGIIFE